jgi:hypothetical protein
MGGVIYAAVLAWLVYLLAGRKVRRTYRSWRASDDPLCRATAAQVAAVEQTSALLLSMTFFAALAIMTLPMPVLGFWSVPLGAAAFLLCSRPIILWADARLRCITS